MAEIEAWVCKHMCLRAGLSSYHQPSLQDFTELNGPPNEGGYPGQSVVQKGKLRLREGEEHMLFHQEEAEEGSKLSCLEPACCSIHRHTPFLEGEGHPHVCPCGFTAWAHSACGQ